MMKRIRWPKKVIVGGKEFYLVDTAKIGLDPFGDYKDFADCVSKNQDKSNPEAFCAWLHEKVTGKTPAEDNTVKGGKRMKKTKADYGHAQSPEEIKAEFEKCVSERMAEGADATPPITRGQAEAICQAETEPADEPGPHPEQLDQEDFESCVATKMEAGLSREEAESQCKKSQADQEEKGGEPDLTPFQKCVNAKMSDGVSREDAEAECRQEHPVAEGDQEEPAGEPEPTPMEKCVKSKVEEGLSEEEAKAWCEDDLAGEHQEATDMVEYNKQLLQMKRDKDIAERKKQRRHPL